MMTSRRERLKAGVYGSTARRREPPLTQVYSGCGAHRQRREARAGAARRFAPPPEPDTAANGVSGNHQRVRRSPDAVNRDAELPAEQCRLDLVGGRAAYGASRKLA